MNRDRLILFYAAFLRALAISLSGLLFGIYLARAGFHAATMGTMITAGLSGAATAALLATVAGDRWGRRKTLKLIAGLTAVGGLIIPFVAQPVMLGAVAFLGMINGMGRDRGAALIMEQAILPATSSNERRTKVFAWYNVLQDAGHAVGALLSGLPVLLSRWLAISDLTALRWMFVGYALLFVLAFALYSFLSPAVETADPQRRISVTPESRRVLWKISSLFALDSIAGGFLTASLLSYFFFQRFGAGEAAIGGLFALSRIANAGSHLGAAWLAKRIGLVNTMVFTHIPSSFLLMTVAIAPNFTVAALLFLLRESLVEMDVPTRQSYVMAMVKPEERTIASGVTHLVRLGGWAIAPLFAGAAMEGVAMAAPLIAGASMKIAYDVLLYFSFRKIKPPEESQE